MDEAPGLTRVTEAHRSHIYGPSLETFRGMMRPFWRSYQKLKLYDPRDPRSAEKDWSFAKKILYRHFLDYAIVGEHLATKSKRLALAAVLHRIVTERKFFNWSSQVILSLFLIHWRAKPQFVTTFWWPPACGKRYNSTLRLFNPCEVDEAGGK